MSELNQFLYRHKTDGKATLVSMISPRGKFLVPSESMDAFWTIYSGCYSEETLGIAELQVGSHIPVLVDVDLKKDAAADGGGVQGLYSIKHVQRLVEIYQKVLREIVNDVKEEHLWCFLMEKPAYVQQKGDKAYCKNGFHLHFPFLFLSRYDQDTYLVPRIRTECKRLAPSEMPACTSADAYIDRGYCKGAGLPWLLYGSRKEGCEHYQLTTVFDPDAKPSAEWRRPLLGYHIYTVDKRPIAIDAHNVDTHLPRVFSIVPFGRDEYICEMNPVITATRTSIPGIPKPKKMNPPAIVGEQDLLSQVEKIMPLLSSERARDRNDWILVGWVLYNIFEGSEIGYEIWVAFSRTCPSLFDESVCYNEWQKMKKKDLTIGTLKFMAKADNPDKYEEIAKNFGHAYLEKSLKLDGTHHDLARALFQQYESQFVCASISGKIWYHFTDHIWKKIDEGVALRSKISSEMVVHYEEMEKALKKKESSAEGDEEVRIKAQRKNINRLIKCLKSSPYKTNVMKEAMEIFYQDGFLARLDANPYLIAFQNGIFDLLNHRFRAGRPDDYISTKMPIHYREFDPLDDEVVEVESFFEKIFPDETVREYFLNISSEIFVGGNSHKIVQVWSGDGDNGKSVTQTLFEKMLGAYNVKLPTSLLVGKRTQSSSACPELCRAGNGVRFAMVQEPDKKDVINVGILKELSGNDTFFARGLYKEGGEITPMFKLAMICNETPKLPYDDKAAWNRIRVIPFESVFTTDAPETYEEQLSLKKFPKDPHFVDKIPKMIEAFAWLLLQRYRMKPRVIIAPPKVMFATTNYRKRNDVFKQFIDELIAIKEDHYLLLNDMYAAFKDWFRESVPQASMPAKQDVTDYFIKLWGDPDSTIGTKRWKGYMLMTDFSMSL